MLSHRVLFDEGAIAARVVELAGEIRCDLPDRKPLMIGLLTGGFVFLADLVRAMARAGIEPRIDFMAVTHYGAGTVTKGTAAIYKDTTLDIRGRSVLVVDDILDSGYTMSAVCDSLRARAPAWFRTCVLLDKPARRAVEIRADYVGFTVPDVWVIGYGLDAGGEGRALPYVGALEGAPLGAAK